MAQNQSPDSANDRPDSELELKRWEGGSVPHEDAAFEAPEPASSRAEHRLNKPHAKAADAPLDPDEKPDQLAQKANEAEDRQEALIDEGIEETFPASDPVSVKRIT